MGSMSLWLRPEACTERAVMIPAKYNPRRNFKSTGAKEQRGLIELLNITSEYLSDHMSNYVPVYGRLPKDQATMLQTIDRALAILRKDEGYRRTLESKRNLTTL
jgi:hypothetical protein